MSTPTRYARWILWSLYYLPQPRPRDLVRGITRIERLRKPWWKWRPNAWHNDDGKEWHITLSDESFYVRRMKLEVDAYITHDGERIVGFDVWDETLRPEDTP